MYVVISRLHVDPWLLSKVQMIYFVCNSEGCVMLKVIEDDV